MNQLDSNKSVGLWGCSPQHKPSPSTRVEGTDWPCIEARKPWASNSPSPQPRVEWAHIRSDPGSLNARIYLRHRLRGLTGARPGSLQGAAPLRRAVLRRVAVHLLKPPPSLLQPLLFALQFRQPVLLPDQLLLQSGAAESAQRPAPSAQRCSTPEGGARLWEKGGRGLISSGAVGGGIRPLPSGGGGVPPSKRWCGVSTLDAPSTLTTYLSGVCFL